MALGVPLQDSQGGSSKTPLVACMSPASFTLDTLEDTINTLR